jgi:acetoin utilization deacetylase AcuC-like enzyme
MCPHTLQAALRAAGAAVQATDLVLAGEAPTAFCNIRPPGHHAERSAAMGFCFFNNVAVGIRHALDVHGLERVALIDFDVHHGNGSEDIFRGDERVLMCSIFEKGLYPFNGENATGPNMVNVGLPSRSGSDAFRAAVTEHWLPALEAFRPQLIYISAGFDAHREDDMGNLGLVEADYAWVTQQLMKVAEKHCHGRVISCLEGGYVLSPLARSVAAHVRVLIGAD